MRLLTFLFVILLLSTSVLAKQAITFPSEDGLLITADIYPSEKALDKETLIILFHQAGSSRGEYRQIAPRLSQLGYSVLAIDQRSGKSFGGVKNKTASQVNVGRDYVKALPDMRAAITYGREKLNAERIIIWGSSYSASLSLVLAGQQAIKVDGVLAFSPGEYFKGKLSIKKEASDISVPVFITAARDEQNQWRAIFNSISGAKTGFIPQGQGKHGSSALFSSDSDEYWQAVLTFLNTHFPISS